MAGLFDTFTVAKRGLSVQQGNINTTSHNIANAQTPGYSRQRAVVETTRPFGGLSKYDSCSYGQIGTGAQITTIQRIRNEFLDYQYRAETTNTGTLGSKYQYLYQVEDILNETTSTGVQGALSAFYDAFQELAKAPEKDSNRTVALKKAEALATALNSRYNQLESKKQDAQKELGNYVTEVNDMLDQINDLNKQISRISAVGMSPNDLLDSRDYLIDQLSSKFGVKIDKDKNNTIDLSVTEDKALGNLVSSDPNDTNYSRFSYVENVTEVKDSSGNITGLKVTYSVLGDKSNQKEFSINGGSASDLESLKETLLNDRILTGNKDGLVGEKVGNVFKEYDDTFSPTMSANAFEEKFAFNDITKGEIAGNQQVQDSIQGYMDELDKLAAALAFSVNAIQTGSTVDGTSHVEGTSSAELLFVIKNDDGELVYTDTGINAKNISLNTKIESDLSLLNCGEKHVDDISGEKDNKRALAIAQLRTLKLNLGNVGADDIADRESFFKLTDGKSPSGIKFADGSTINLTSIDGTGSKLSDYYASTISKLAVATSSTKSELSTQSTLLANLDNQRLSESGVSLDEEMADLIQFQHSYQANAKMINTIDELLDVVINGLKR